MTETGSHDAIVEFRTAVGDSESSGVTRKYIAAVSSVLDKLEAAADAMEEVSAIAGDARARDLNNVEHEEEAIELNELAVRMEVVLDRLSERVYS